MRKVSQKEKEIINILNEKRKKAFIDIYKETDFSGLGILVDEEFIVYKYEWKTNFNKENNNFGIINNLFKYKNKINYQELEDYLINELNIVEKKYMNSDSDIEKYSEIIKLEKYVNEFANAELFDLIKDKIGTIIGEKII